MATTKKRTTTATPASRWSERPLTAKRKKAGVAGPDGGFVAAHLEDRDGHTVIVPDEPVPPLTTEMVREVLEHVRK